MKTIVIAIIVLIVMVPTASAQKGSGQGNHTHQYKGTVTASIVGKTTYGTPSVHTSTVKTASTKSIVVCVIPYGVPSAPLYTLPVGSYSSIDADGAVIASYANVNAMQVYREQERCTRMKRPLSIVDNNSGLTIMKLVP